MTRANASSSSSRATVYRRGAPTRLSPKTCAKHIERILEKLGVHSRAQAVAIAYRDELIAVRS